jgi:hypothetical protein
MIGRWMMRLLVADEQSLFEVWGSSSELIFEEWLGPLAAGLVVAVELASGVVGAERGPLAGPEPNDREQQHCRGCERASVAAGWRSRVFTHSRHHSTS